jgi:hypothetical protein
MTNPGHFSKFTATEKYIFVSPAFVQQKLVYHTIKLFFMKYFFVANYFYLIELRAVKERA